MQKSMNRFRIILILILVAAIGAGIYYLFGNYSSGYRAGTMVKFSRKGNIIKTYEGHLNLGMVINEPGTTTTGTQVANIWTFTVKGSDTAAIRKIEEALLTGKRVKLHYNEKFIRLFWRGDTKYFVDEAELMR